MWLADEVDGLVLGVVVWLVDGVKLGSTRGVECCRVC